MQTPTGVAKSILLIIIKKSVADMPDNGGNPSSNIKRLLNVANQMGASYRVKKAIVEAALVESNGRHIRYGDRDSVGILQQRPSMGWGSPNDSIEKDAKDFLSRAIKLDKSFKGSSGQLAQAVQRSAFPDRYDQRGRDAAKYIGQGGGQSSGGMGQVSGSVTASATVPGVDRSKERMLAKLQYLQTPEQSQSTMGSGLIGLKQTLDTLADTPAQTATSTKKYNANVPLGGTQSPSGKTDITQLAAMAKRFGLAVREDGVNDKVDPVHASGSYHYRKSGHGAARAAFDASGDPAKMQQFARAVAQKYGKSLEELFWNGPGAANIKNGKRVGKGFVSGHTDHVHVADVD